jgi:hypothetical protein
MPRTALLLRKEWLMLAQKIQWIRKSQKKFPVDASDQAGSMGERMALNQLQGILKKLGCEAEIYQSLRVPKHKGPGKYEIDLLLVSEAAVLVIEVKHWGGRLIRERGDWVQEKGREKKVLQDPVKLNQEKLEALKQWLLKRRVVLPPQTLHSLVVFTHPDVLVSHEIKDLDAVVGLSSLLDLALAKCAHPKRFFWQKKPTAVFDFSALNHSLQDLPTWDRLRFYGGRICHGDLEYIVLPDVQPSALQRKYLRRVEVLLSRRLFPGLFLRAQLRVTDWAGKRTTYPLAPDAKLVFCHAGQNVKEEVSWLHVESLDLGWKDHSYYEDR